MLINQLIINEDFYPVGLHIGQKITEIAKSKHVSFAELARRIHTSPQNMGKILKKDSIDTKQLVRISQALKHNFFQYYNEEVALEWYEMDFVPSTQVGKAVEESESKVEKLEKRLEKLEKDMAAKEIGYLKEINELLEGGGE